MTRSIMTVDDYIAAQPDARHDALQAVRGCIRRAAPDAAESIRYDMPAYRLPNGHPVYFAGWKHHRSGKDTLKFPYRDPIPFDLITRTIAAIGRRRA